MLVSMLSFLLISVLGTIITSASAMTDGNCRTMVSGVHVHSVPFQRSDPSSPWCYASSFVLPSDECIDNEESIGNSNANGSVNERNSDYNYPNNRNFLASQVWPSARVAASKLLKLSDPEWDTCELGCGPGLPSLAIAARNARYQRDGDGGGGNISRRIGRSIATDIDAFSLDLVIAAAQDQDLHSSSTTIGGRIGGGGGKGKRSDGHPWIETRIFDLLDESAILPDVDLYLMSDVFESRDVARGAAFHTAKVLKRGEGRKVWVFAQNDRSQRDWYVQYLKKFLTESLLLPTSKTETEDPSLHWALEWSPIQPELRGKNEGLWLCDVDETIVNYG